MKFTRFCTIFRHLDSNWMPSSLVTKAKIKTKITTATTTTKTAKRKKPRGMGRGGRFWRQGIFEVSIQIYNVYE